MAAAAYSTAASANATVAGTAQAKLLFGAPASTSTALQAANSGVAADGQAQATAALQAVSARKAADAKSRSAAAKRAAAAAKLQKAAGASAAAAQQAVADKAAEAKRKAAEAAKQKAEEAKRAKAAATSRSNTRPPASTGYSGDPQAYAASLLGSYGWSQSQMSCLVSLWNRESGWRVNATNPSSGAYGIPQSLPGSKMASAGADWQTNPATQIRWGLGYIKATYGSPCGAWGHSQATGWY